MSASLVDIRKAVYPACSTALPLRASRSSPCCTCLQNSGCLSTADAKYVESLRELLKELGGQEWQGIPSCISAEQEKLYHERVDAVAKSILETVKKPTDLSALDAGSTHAFASPQSKKVAATAPLPQSGIRRRHSSSNEDGEGESTSLLGTSTQQRLRTQMQLHESITEEMTRLSAALKENVKGLGTRIQEGNQRLDSTMTVLEKNMGAMGHANKFATKVYNATSIGTCWTIGILAVVMVIFVWMVLFIKTTSYL
eukprot:jgi/Mesvir1/27252/Mv07092-RA.1